ncbi:MAG: hypothetical protein IJX47_08740 [Clostridia bacterium]|nr:hypothetical protein [Clostridia bacterium]
MVRTNRTSVQTVWFGTVKTVPYRDGANKPRLPPGGSCRRRRLREPAFRTIPTNRHLGTNRTNGRAMRAPTGTVRTNQGSPFGRAPDVGG